MEGEKGYKESYRETKSVRPTITNISDRKTNKETDVTLRYCDNRNSTKIEMRRAQLQLFLKLSFKRVFNIKK